MKSVKKSIKSKQKKTFIIECKVNSNTTILFITIYNE